MGVATRTRPICQLGVNALAVHHQRAHQADVLPLEFTHQLRSNTLRRLRLHRSAIVRAMLRAQLHIEQAQEMPHLGGCAHGRFAATAAQALLNRHGGRNAIHRIHLRATCGLHDAACISVKAF